MGKIAILFFGQPRFIHESFNSIKQEFTFPGYTTDYFFHFWDKVAYRSNDPESDIDKRKLIKLINPTKYSFSDYTDLNNACVDIFELVQEGKKSLKDKSVILPQNIFSIKTSQNLRYYLGQFVSLQKVVNILKKYTQQNNIKYDIVFRVRTDLFFPGRLWYETLKSPRHGIYNSSEKNEEQVKIDEYEFDKYLTYIKPLERYKKGIFSNKGEISIWEKIKVVQDDMIDSTKKSFTGRAKQTVSAIEFEKEGVLFCTSRDGRKCIVLFDEDYIYTHIDYHIKDWLIWGDQDSIINTHDKLIEAVQYHITRSAHRLNKINRDNSWGAGELITGLAAVLSKTNIYDPPLSISRINCLQMRRFFKIINKNSKENMLGLEDITVKHNTPDEMIKSCRLAYKKQSKIDNNNWAKGNEHM